MADKPFEILIRPKDTDPTSLKIRAHSMAQKFIELNENEIVCKPFRVKIKGKKRFVKGLFECYPKK